MTGSQVRKVSALVIGMTVAGSAIAWGGGYADALKDEHHGGKESCGMGGSWQGRSEMLERELSSEQVQTLAEARLIMMGNENIKVGSVDTTDNGYSVSIVTNKSGDLVRTMELATNGLPLNMMERLQERDGEHKHHSHGKKKEGRGERKGGHGAAHKGMGARFEQALDRELSKDDVHTLAEARLILQGNENLKVGTVKPTEDGYSVSIVTTQSGDLVRSMELAKNGIPMRVMDRIEEQENRRLSN